MFALMKIKSQLLIILLVMIAYALVGVLFFKGKIENRCRLTPFPINGTWPIDETILSLCGEYECPNG